LKLLKLDIETAPNIAYVWGLFKENIPIQRLKDSGYVLCWSAQWVGDDEVYFASEHANGTGEMLAIIHDLLDEADAVIHYNGSNFDIPTLNKEFLKWGFAPPAPYKQIDLYKVVKKQFRLPSYKLDYVAKNVLELEGKLRHPGFEMWVDCMHGDAEAWKNMEEYNKQDVVLLGQVYDRLLPWIDGHPKHGLYAEDVLACPACGSHHLQKRGYAYTAVGKFQRYQCQDCGHWSRDGKNIAVKGILR
jgi:DNA polymerase elongation subunit (family B)